MPYYIWDLKGDPNLENYLQNYPYAEEAAYCRNIPATNAAGCGVSGSGCSQLPAILQSDLTSLEGLLSKARFVFPDTRK